MLVIAIHAAMQVFRPSKQIRSDGLHPYRCYVYIGAIFIPIIMASLAFINPHRGYMSQGAFCSLPLRPFWYRLALTWIPRYIIAVIILGLAIAIYTHVGLEFRSLSKTDQGKIPSVSTGTTMLTAAEVDEVGAAVPEMGERYVYPQRRGSSIRSVAGPSIRGSAVPAIGKRPGYAADAHRSDSNAPSSPNLDCSSVQAALRRPSGDDSDSNSSPPSHVPTTSFQHQLVQQRARIHRHLRLMFIYPIVYILMWMIPFVHHCMTYNDHWAAHPLYWLSLLSNMCVALMGAVDSLIFCLRERPWRHIPSSDGSFLGSFLCWHTCPPTAHDAATAARLHRSETGQHPVAEANPETPCAEVPPTWLGSIKRVGSRMQPRGASSDQAHMEALMARTRLGLEKKDRRAAYAEAREEDRQAADNGRSGGGD